MSELLLELFSEEIPARMQRNAAEALKTGLKAAFDEAKLAHESIETFVTPRRIVAVAKGLPKAIEATETEKRGPKLGAPQGAIDGFCKGAGITTAQLEERDGYYFAVIRSAGGDVASVLKSLIEKILGGFHWPKSMRWGAHPLVWVRPLQSILCLFDGNIVPVSLGHVTAGNSTKGHRFLSDNAPVTVTNSEDYFAKLRAAHVIVNQDERRDTIAKNASAEAAKHGLTVKPDAGLLDEVTGLVEWPVVLIGGFEERYLALPQEVPTTVMRAHQKYFALQNGDKLANKFAVVSNMVASDGGKVITSGNERVLRARLSDGQFFYDQDLKTPLADWNKGLSDMVFHAKVKDSSVADKVERIKALAAKLIAFVPGADAADVARAAELCKADLTTGMVGEFPELQGLMGRYYATAQGEKPAVADAIRDHYSPLGPTDDCPTAPVSVTIALADKLDTLVSMFDIGEKPTGSKDPFALRRAALGVIRLILENNLRLKLIQYVNAELLEFFIARLKVSLKDEGIAHDRIDAVLKNGFNGDLTQLVARVRALDAFLKTTDGANLLAGAKRALNILNGPDPKNAPLVESRLILDEEKALAAGIKEVAAKVDTSLIKEDFASAMQQISTLRPTIDAFFNKVIVKADDAAIRENRFALLARLTDIFDKIADFSLIEG